MSPFVMPDKQKLWWQGCSSDELDELARSTRRRETMSAIEVQISSSTPSSTPLATCAKSIASRRHQSKHIDNQKHVKTRRSIDWKLVGSVFILGTLRLHFGKLCG
jgi:hypothetical protein